MIHIEILRMYKEKCTLGHGKVIEDDNVLFEFKTLELPWRFNERKISCIPADEYEVVKVKPNTKRNYEYFHVTKVPGRDGILFHPGNYTSQILGCILPGEKHTDLNNDGVMDITNTTSTLKKLTGLMPDKFKLIIK